VNSLFAVFQPLQCNCRDFELPSTCASIVEGGQCGTGYENTRTNSDRDQPASQSQCGEAGLQQVCKVKAVAECSGALN